MEQRIHDFLQFIRQEKGYSENTIVAYQNDLTQFMDSLTHSEVPPPVPSWPQMPKHRLGAYIDQLKQSDYSSSTVARKIAALKSFFHFLVAEGDLSDDPTLTLDSPKVQKRVPQPLTLQEIDRLLDAPTQSGDSPKSQRDLALLEMLYASGMRVTELVSLDTTDLTFESKQGSIAVRGKKNNTRTRTIPINGAALDALQTYVQRGREQLVQDLTETALFVNNRGRRLTRQGLWLIIKHYVKSVGITTHVTPHTLRHSFAAHKLSQGKSLQDIQKLLGHANISTTQVYTQFSGQ